MTLVQQLILVNISSNNSGGMTMGKEGGMSMAKLLCGWGLGEISLEECCRCFARMQLDGLAV